MVSLCENIRRLNSSGGYFFDGSQMNSDREDLVPDDDSEIYELQPFRKINVPPFIIVLIVVVVSLGLVSVFLPLNFISSHLGSMSPLPLLIGCHCVVWITTAGLQYVLHKKHKLSRTYGYLDLYRQTASLRRAPLIILSFGSICILITISIVQSLCFGKPSYVNCHKDWPHRLVYYVQGLLILEVIIVAVNLSFYLAKTLSFNKSKPLPDVDQDDCVYLTSNNTINDIGFRDESQIDEVLEKQADMIRYLKRHNIYLSKKIFQLTNNSTTAPSISSLNTISVTAE